MHSHDEYLDFVNYRSQEYDKLLILVIEKALASLLDEDRALLDEFTFSEIR